MAAAALTIEDAAAALADGRLTARGLLEECLARADRLDERLGSLLARDDEAARAAADRADQLFAEGTRLGPLQGIPVAIKDVLTTTGLPTTGQSEAMPAAWAPQVDALVVGRLREAGAVVVGKTTTMEFAVGMPDRTKPFPLPRNPWDLERWAGGSSSGTANGVAAGLFLGGVGTDTGGSIRLPSAFCGITGLKPTAGLVPTDGCVPLARSLDSVGPMARSARDCGYLLAAMSGKAGRLRDDVPGLPGLRLAVERDHHVRAPGVDPATVAAFEDALNVLAELGADLTEVSIPRYEELAIASQVVLLTEALEQHSENLRRCWQRYGTHTRRRLLHGLFFTAEDVARAWSVLRGGRAFVAELLGAHDAIVCLTAGTSAEPLAALGLEGHMAAAGLTFTRIWNPIGAPAMSVPIGFTSDGVPAGMQIVGRPDDDDGVIRIAEAYQQRTSWHRREPPLVPPPKGAE